MKIILISGKAQVGKDTFATKLKNLFGNSQVYIAAYADMLKRLSARNFNYEGKLNNGRNILQDVGDKIRYVDKDAFVKPVALQAEIAKKLGYKIFLITDCRYDNEIIYFKNNFDNVIAIKLERDFISPLSEESKSHPSENILNPNLIDIVITLENNIEYDIKDYLKILKES